MERGARATGRLGGRAPEVALALFGAALAAWSWGQWPDVQVDFGRELYGAWRVAEGDVPYRDLAWFNGPLSLGWNALWFRVAGTSLRTLVVVNLALLALTAVLLHRALGRWAGPTAARAGVATFLGVFAFARYSAYGNYDFVAPYSHELTHGFVLALAGLAALSKLGRGGRGAWAFAAGVCLGAALLTKAEVFAAAAAACVLRLALHLASPQSSARLWTTDLFVAGALLPPVLAWAWLRTALPGVEAVRGVLGAWVHLGNEELGALPFYRAMLGTDDPAHHLERTALWTAGLAAVLALPLVLAARLDARRGGTRAARAVAFALGAGLTLAAVAGTGAPWLEVARPFPVVLVVLLLVLAARWVRRRHDALLADELAFALFALALLAKTALFPRLRHYGFVLGLPATLVVVALFVDRLPRALEERGRAGAFLRAAGLGVLAVFVSAHLREGQAWYHGLPPGFQRYERVTVGQGADRFVAGWRGAEVNAALADLDRRLAPDDTLLVVPEGAMLNYLLRRRTPTRVVNFMPPELLMFGEAAILAALEANPPAAVALVHKDTSEYGARWFGVDYGRALGTWIQSHYAPDATYGAVPLAGGGFGIQVLVPR